MIFNKDRKRKQSVIDYFNYLNNEVIPKDIDSEVVIALNDAYNSGISLIENNEWGAAFENISEELTEHFFILDRKGIELAQTVVKLCKLDANWVYRLRKIVSSGYKNGSWKLSDAEELAKQYKYTFYKPSRKITSQLKPGNIAKLTFQFDSANDEHPSAERMWVMIKEIKEDRFLGYLKSSPIYIFDLFTGDEIEFEHKHIIDHDLGITEPNLVDKYHNRCFVTSKVLYNHEKVHYLYRETPMKKDPERDYVDTGWRILAGDETDEYMGNSENIHLVSLGAVLSRDDSFIDVLDAPIGSAFEKNESGKFALIEKSNEN
ncbi:MAG: DUF2185 domain-containing protein [bacterium]|nr:DUF2185 domain-containing protein [bacterium]